MKIQESAENYLETILVLSQGDKPVRSIDVCEHMGFSKPSVSRAMGILKNDGYVTVAPNGYIELTDEGMAIAEKIYARHKLLTSFLVCLGVDEKIAMEDACKIEHDISDESFLAIKNHVESHNK